MCRQVCSIIPCNIFGTRMFKFYSVLRIKFRILKCTFAECVMVQEVGWLEQYLKLIIME